MLRQGARARSDGRGFFLSLAHARRARAIKDWSLTSLKERLIKIGVVSHGRYIASQMAEVVISRTHFADILRLITEVRPPPVTSTA
jgi:hypothetical protein